jgi:hypothetical protein
MNLLTNSAMNQVIEINGAFLSQMPARSSKSNPAAPFDQIPADDRCAAAPMSGDAIERSNARSDAARFGMAVLAVIGAATLWGWSIMQLCGLFLHAESLLLRTTLPL